MSKITVLSQILEKIFNEKYWIILPKKKSFVNGPESLITSFVHLIIMYPY